MDNFMEEEERKAKLAAYHKNYYAANKERLKQYQKDYYRANPEIVSQYHKEYREKYAERRRAYSTQWNNEHKEHKQEYLQRYYQKTSDTHRLVSRQDYLKKREWYAALNATYKRDHPEQVRMYSAVRTARKRHVGGDITTSQWREIKAKYNYTCLCCGRREPDIRLSIDHVIPIVKGGTSNIDNIQPLCRSCNSSKHTKIIDYRSTWEGDLRA